MSLNLLARWQSLWLSRLISRLTNQTSSTQTPDSNVTETTTQVLMQDIHHRLNSLAYEFNQKVGLPSYRITLSDPHESKEDSEGGTFTYTRCRISTSFWSLSVRALPGSVEFFILPVSELLLLGKAELPSRLVCKLTLDKQENFWMLEDLPVNDLELEVIVKNLFRDLVLYPVRQPQVSELKHIVSLQGESLTHAIQQLISDKQNLVQKIITQQEALQNSIARDLHDAVISDVMMLKRTFTGDQRLSDKELLKVLDQMAQKLREICHDLAPRDLKDWGLETVIDDLLQSLAERTGADCAFNSTSDIPDLPSAVQLHIYRIAQECLNNIEKYAQASRVRISLDYSHLRLKLVIQDNGKGFLPQEISLKKSHQGGRGMGSMFERTELIASFYPAQLSIESQPGQGSTVCLEITLPGSAGDF